jgi:hypothetical protein
VSSGAPSAPGGGDTAMGDVDALRAVCSWDDLRVASLREVLLRLLEERRAPCSSWPEALLVLDRFAGDLATRERAERERADVVATVAHVQLAQLPVLIAARTRWGSLDFVTRLVFP